MHSREKRKRGNTAQLASELAPLEELDTRSPATQPGDSSQPGDSQADQQYGVIVVDNDSLKIPKDMMEGGDEKTFLGMELVVIVILCILLGFIAFVAWQISLMPAKSIGLP